MARKLIVEIIGDASSLERSYKRSANATKKFGREINQAGRGATVATVGFKGLGRTVAFASGAFLGGAGLATAARAAFSEFAEGQKVAAQTATALKSTGGAATVTAAQINQLAGRIQQFSGYDDEAVQSAENLLLTFTSIRNEVGAGNDIFSQTTRAVADMSRAFDQDLSTSAIQLGKALNDPTQGLSALRRIGISFTDSQVKTIKRLQETGRMLEAQKIILREVNREVGGSAKAYGKTLPGQLDILRGNLSNTAGTFAKVLAPSIQEALGKANKWLANAKNQKRINDDLTTSVNILADAFEGLVTAIGLASDALRGFTSYRQQVKDMAGPLGFLLTGPRALGDTFGKALFNVADGIGLINKNVSHLEPRPFRLIEGYVQGIAAALRQALQAPNALSTIASDASRAADIIAKAAPAPRVATVGQRNTWFDRMIGRLELRAGYLTSLRAKQAAFQHIAELLQDRIKITKDITRRQNLADELFGVQARIREIAAERRRNADAAEQRAADAAKKREEAAKRREQERLKRANEAVARARKFIDATNKQAFAEQAYYAGLIKRRGDARRAAAAAREQRQQFLQLGLTATGEERLPGINVLRARGRQLEQRLAGTILDTTKMHSLFGRIRRVLAGEFGKVTKDTLRAIDSLLDQIAGKLGDRQGQLTRAGAVGGHQLALALSQGLNLTDPELNRFQNRLNQAKLTAQQPIHVHVEVDSREIGHAATKGQNRDRYRTARQTSGFRG